MVTALMTGKRLPSLESLLESLLEFVRIVTTRAANRLPRVGSTPR